MNAKNKKGMTPLHFAIYKDNSEIVELLIDKGADVNTKSDDNSDTPLHVSVNNGQS